MCADQQEIVGGLLELEPDAWLHPRADSFAAQQKRVLKFSEQWRDYDWTADLDSADFA